MGLSLYPACSWPTAASAGHHAWSAAPWTWSFHLSLRGGALPPEHGRHGRGR